MTTHTWRLVLAAGLLALTPVALLERRVLLGLEEEGKQSDIRDYRR